MLQSPINSHTHYDPLQIDTSPGSVHTCLRSFDHNECGWRKTTAPAMSGGVFPPCPAQRWPGQQQRRAQAPTQIYFYLRPTHSTAQHSTAQHSTAQCAPQPVPWLEAGAAWGMRAISSNQTAGGEASTHILAQSSSSLVTLTPVTPPPTAALPRTLDPGHSLWPKLAQSTVTSH